MVTSGVSQVERMSKDVFKTSDLRRAASLSSFAAREWLKGSQTLQTHCEPGTRSWSYRKLEFYWLPAGKHWRTQTRGIESFGPRPGL